MFKRPKIEVNIDVEKLLKEGEEKIKESNKKIKEIEEQLKELEEKMSVFPITVEMARAISEVRDNKYKEEWQPIVDKFLENCYRDIKKACSEGEFQQNKITINYSAEEPYYYAANEVRKELIKMGFRVTGDYSPFGGHLFIFW